MKTDRNVGMDTGTIMSKTLQFPRAKALQYAGASLIALSLLLTMGAAQAADKSANTAPTNASASRQQTFDTPEQAAAALAAAWHEGGKPALLAIFGRAGMKLVSSGDPVAEKNAAARLAAEYDAAHKIETIDAQKALLLLGAGEFPSPIPIVKERNAWRFDTLAGEQEIIDRRIGRNELSAIRVCRTYVDAQREFAAGVAAANGAHDYAAKVVSSAGKHDGLYWPAKEGEAPSPLGPLFAVATAEGYGAPGAGPNAPYHGYRYKILTQQGADAQGGPASYFSHGRLIKGFALVAYPATYGDSGVMTFIVNQHGIVFEKNLGPDTAHIAQKMTAYNPDRSWKPVDKP
jgi:hypothetical protein